MLTPDPKTYVRPVSLADNVLRAVRTLEDLDGWADLSELVRLAWQLDRRAGLPGYTETYPSDKRVSSEVQHLIRRGLMVRIRPNTYRLTASGRMRVKSLEPKEREYPRLCKEEIKKILEQPRTRAHKRT